MPIVFRQLFDAVSSTYTYLLGDPDTREAVLIDPVYEQYARDAALVRELDLTLKFCLDTHCHADHVTAAWLMKQALGSEIVLSVCAGAANVDREVDHGDVIRFGGLALEVRATPGHTNCCVTYVDSDHNMAFTGDCLLIRGAGRTDFQQGCARKLYHSIQRQIFTLPDDCLIYPGHDYAGRTVSSVGEEKAHNPRVGGRANEGDFVGYMENLGLPHPRKIDVALPANLRSGKPIDGELPRPAAWGPVVVTYAGIFEIEPEWVASHRDQVHVLDVRAPSELDSELGGIDGAQVIPIDELSGRIGDVPRDKPVVVVCRSGRRSAQATRILRKAGWTDVANIAGGMLRWREIVAMDTPRP